MSGHEIRQRADGLATIVRVGITEGVMTVQTLRYLALLFGLLARECEEAAEVVDV